jgi:uncharacterized membrane protein
MIILILGYKVSVSEFGIYSKTSEVDSKNILMSGGGNEPGWNFQIRGNQLNNSPKGFDLIADYGESEWSGVVALVSQEDYSQDFQFRGDLDQIDKNSSSTETSARTKSIIIYFESKECFDDAGNKHNFSAELNFNSEKEYKGCADIK